MTELTMLAVALSRSVEAAVVIKGTVVLLAALTAVAFAAKARASARHLVLASAFAALIAMPLLMLAVPRFTLDVPVKLTGAVDDAPIATAEPFTAAGPRTSAANAPQKTLTTADWLRIGWAGGAVLFLLPVAAALSRLSMIRRTGLPVAWHRAELARLADARGVSLPVELLEHEAVPGPMTFGVRRPVIVLPPDAREWSEGELRCALMHEIEHIQRGDWLMQIVARTVAAVYWFNPLVWKAWRRLCLEAERSCDDAVVMSEERTEYAEQLVTLAQRMSAAPVQPLLGMANRSDLSTRVTAVLDDRLQRGRSGFALAAGTVAAAALLVLTVTPVRAIAVVDAGESAATASAEQPGLRAKGQRRTRAIDRALYEAANAGDFEEVRELVAAGADPSAVVAGDGSPLIGAARSGRIEITRYLLDQGADPNGVVPGDGSALIAAAQNGRLEHVRALIDRGADVNLAVAGDENPLMNAAEGGHLAIVQLLVDKGADVHVRIYTERYDGGGEWRTAISQARKNGHHAVVSYLASLGARD